MVETLEALRVSGKIRFWGISTDDVVVVKRLMKLGEIGVLQVRYNLIQRRSESLLEFARGRAIGTLIRVPLAKGILTGKYFGGMDLPERDVRYERSLLPEVRDAVAKAPALGFLAQSTGRTMTQAAIRFVLDNPAVSCVIAGAKTAAQIEENAGASGVPPLTQDERLRAAKIASEIDIGEVF